MALKKAMGKKTVAAPLKKKAAPVAKAKPAPLKRKFENARKITGQSLIFMKWTEWEIGNSFIGKYIGPRKDTKYKKTGRIFEIEEANFEGPNGEDLTGKQLVCNECAGINSAFKGANTVKPGQIVQVEYQGMAEVTGGDFAGKDMHVVEVTIDDDDTKEAGDESDWDNDSDEEEESEEDGTWF